VFWLWSCSQGLWKPQDKDQKAFNITLSDIDEEETLNYMAFVASYDFDNSKQSDV
jgi:hypothetical protein